MHRQVLLIEDDSDIREDLAALLEHAGYHVLQAANGKDALERLRAGASPCIILLDLMMPVMNGWDFRTAQLADPALRDIPTIILSGATQLKEAAAALQATAFLQKPFSLAPLLATVGQHC